MRNCSSAMWIAMVLVLGGSVVPADGSDEIVGAWDLTVDEGGKPHPSWVKFFTNGGEKAADFVGRTGGVHSADRVTFHGNQADWRIGKRNYRVECAGDRLTGEVREDPQGVVARLAGRRLIRRADLSGTWMIKVAIPMRTMVRELTLQHTGNEIRGTYVGGRFSAQRVRKATFQDERFRFQVDVREEDLSVTYFYDLAVHGDRMTGTFRLSTIAQPFDAIATRGRTWGEPISLFNGKDLSQWSAHPAGAESHWTVDAGALVNGAPGANLRSRRQFTDFKLKADVKVPAGGNSGIYLCGRYEIQVADDFGKAPGVGGMGAVYGRIAPSANASRKAGEWQHLELTFVDHWLTLVLNGKTVIDNQRIEGITGGAMDSNEAEPGPILLQGDHGPVAYRDVVVNPLTK